MRGGKFSLTFVIVTVVLLTLSQAAQAQQLNAPTGFSGNPTGTDSIDWTWTDTNTAPNNESGHRVLDTNWTPATSDDIIMSNPDIGADIVTWSETGLNENTEYERYVIATGSTGMRQRLDSQETVADTGT